MTILTGTPPGSAPSVPTVPRRFRLALFDLDDTLYRVEAIPKSVKRHIEEYLVDKLAIPAAEAPTLATQLYLNYGTTLSGLVANGHAIDFDDWHKDVHWKLEYEKLLQPDPPLRDLLQRMDIPSYILTNADRKHASICLDLLGITDCFQGVYSFETVMELGMQRGLLSAKEPVLCKPSPKVYEMVLQQLGVQAHECIFLDDSVRNVAAAHALGIYSVLVGRHGEAKPGEADLQVIDVHQLPSALPQLFGRAVAVEAGLGGDEQQQAEATPQPICVAAG